MGFTAAGFPPVTAGLAVAGSSVGFEGWGSIFGSFTPAAILSLHSRIDISNTNSMAAAQ